MVVITALLALAVLGLGWVLVTAVSQNRALWSQLQGIDRPLRGLLRDALVLWSPLALVIVVLAFAANRMGAAAVSLSYHLGTLDEFCEVRDLPGHLVIPCTGMSGVLPPGALKLAGPQADIEHYVALRYRQARTRFLSLSADQLRLPAGDRAALRTALSPRGVLALAPAPQDDPELLRLQQELRTLLAAPSPPSGNVLELWRFAGERELRAQRMRALTARVLARRERLAQAAYGPLTTGEQGRLWLRNHLSHLLATLPAPPDAATASALATLASANGRDGASLAAVQRGILVQLARNEAAVTDILRREAATRTGAAGLYLALPIARRCTVAAADESLRLRSSDFADDGIAAIDPSRFLQSNSGSFPCFAVATAPQPLRLRSLGFQDSVRRSIERWHGEVQDSSFRRLGQLSLRAGDSATDAKAAARAMALAVPTGIHLGRADCGLLQLDNCMANLAREGAEAGYARARADMAQSYQRQAQAVAGTAGRTLDQHIAETLPTLDAHLEQMREGAHAYADRLFTVNLLLRILGWLAVALVAVKSFLYVLALELFHTDEAVSFGFDDARPIEGQYRAGRRLTIDRDFPHPLITRKQLSNTDNNVCLAPWPWSSPLTRIWRRCYFIFTKGSFLADAGQVAGAGETGEAGRGMVASAGGGLSMVEWQLQPGEEVIFRFEDFYGASDNVQLRSEWSFRLSTLLLGKVRFHVACCPDDEGRLLLKANVEEIDQALLRAIPPERMIAWNRHARFTIHSGRTLWKTLLNGYTLVRQERDDGPSGRILVSSDDVGSNLGSIRFVRRIFSAIF